MKSIKQIALELRQVGIELIKRNQSVGVGEFLIKECDELLNTGNELKADLIEMKSNLSNLEVRNK